MTCSSLTPAPQNPQIDQKTKFYTVFSYVLLIVSGLIRDLLGYLTGLSRYKLKPKPGYAPLSGYWDDFFIRRLYDPIQDCWNRPLCSSAATRIQILERVTQDGGRTYLPTSRSMSALNLGSYNYLGFADDWKETCAPTVEKTLEEWPISLCSTPLDLGTTALHRELEKLVARFVGKEDALVFSIGYGANASVLPVLCGPETLILCSEFSHGSLRNGALASGAELQMFRHNDLQHLEELLQAGIRYGQKVNSDGEAEVKSVASRPWKKILVMVEGVYSMEGSISRLREISALCRLYRTYLYVDEAHSIGALGATGRGVCEHSGVSPSEVDVLMGSFSKAFAGMGGYVAASAEVIQHLRTHVAGSVYHGSMSPVLVSQALSALRLLLNDMALSKQKIEALRENTLFFRRELVKRGLHILGEPDCPSVPILLYVPSKIAAFSRECLERGVAVVVVGVPATPPLLSRARVCLSAGMSREDLQRAVQVIDEVADKIQLKYAQ